MFGFHWKLLLIYNTKKLKTGVKFQVDKSCNNLSLLPSKKYLNCSVSPIKLLNVSFDVVICCCYGFLLFSGDTNVTVT